MATRRELKDAIRQRYKGSSDRGQRRQILAEFVRVTGYHCKHALRVLNHPPTPPTPRRRERLYDPGSPSGAGSVVGGGRSHLRQAAASSDPSADRGDGTPWPSPARSGGKKPAARHQCRHYRSPVAPATRGNRACAPAAVGRGLGSPAERTGADLRRLGDPPPGYLECDLVEHCGGVKNGGNFVHTLTLTDIHSGWTECVALAVREQSLVVEGISAIAQGLPFALRGSIPTTTVPS
jgi:hypothetical protein